MRSPTQQESKIASYDLTYRRPHRILQTRIHYSFYCQLFSVVHYIRTNVRIKEENESNNDHCLGNNGVQNVCGFQPSL